MKKPSGLSGYLSIGAFILLLGLIFDMWIVYALLVVATPVIALTVWKNFKDILAVIFKASQYHILRRLLINILLYSRDSAEEVAYPSRTVARSHEGS